jgi:hypothetical protein
VRKSNSESGATVLRKVNHKGRAVKNFNYAVLNRLEAEAREARAADTVRNLGMDPAQLLLDKSNALSDALPRRGKPK